MMLLFFIEIANACSGVDAGLGFDCAALDKNLVDQRRLARITVAADGDVPNRVDTSDHDYSL